MPSGRAGLRAEKVRSVAAWAAVALVAWQAEECVRDVAAELGRPFAQHVLVLRASPEELIRRKLGEDYAILVALREQLPRDANVRVSFADDKSGYRELRRRSTWLGALLYPMVLEGWPFHAERAPRAATGSAAR